MRRLFSLFLFYFLVQCLSEALYGSMLQGQKNRNLVKFPESKVQIHHHHHQSLNCEGHWGTADDFATSFFHFSLFSTALWDLPNSRPVHSLMLSSHLFLYLPCLLPAFIVPCKMVLARPDEWETWPYHCSLRLFTILRRSSCGPIACWILARTSSLVTWSLYEMCSISARCDNLTPCHYAKYIVFLEKVTCGQ